MSNYPRDKMASADAELRQSGYCVVEGVLSSDKAAVLASHIDEIAHYEQKVGSAWYSHSNQRVYMLLNKGEIFRELINNQVALALARSILGTHCLLSSITANIAVPGNHAQPLHADQDYMATPWTHSEVCNIAFLLDDFTADNGATVVVPGSHIMGTPPPSEDALSTVSITAPRGSLICLDGRVWHGTGKNSTSAEPRRAIFCYFCKPYIRQQENITRSLLPEIRERLTPAERQLLGFDIWMALGAVNGLPPAWMDGRERIGPGLDEKLVWPR